MSPWVCYLIADGLELSGIVAIMTNGVFLNYYAAPNLSRTSKEVAKVAIEAISYTAETVVFLFLGIGVFTFEAKYSEVSVLTIILGIINVNFARFVNIWSVSKIVNRYRSDKNKVTYSQQAVMWLAGLRGAMAYALSIQSSLSPTFMNPKAGKFSGDVMLIVSIIFSIFTLVGVSSFLHPLIHRLGVTQEAI